MHKNYMYQKTNNLYININPNTYNYRNQILSQIQTAHHQTFNISTSKPFNQYLSELASHHFCLCIRGNGIDTHRFWESLYLGVIPVIINNQYTNISHFVTHLKNLNIPFYEITQDFLLEKYTDNFFNETLYKQIIKNSNSSIYNLEQLKLSYYI
jgi:hypothetical protein